MITIDFEKRFNTANDLESLLDVLLTTYFEVFDVYIGSIQLYAENQFFTKIHRNFPDKVRLFFKFENGQSLSDFVLQSKERLYIEDFANQSHIQGCPLLSVRSLMCIPIYHHEQLLAHINLINTDSMSFPSIDDDLQESLMDQTALALRSSLLIEEVNKKRTYDKELDAAMAIQKQLLPVNVPYTSHFDFGRISIASKELSGDFHDFIALPNDQIGMIVVDITGKGIQAGLFISMIKSMLRIFLPEYESPKDAMQKINEVLCSRDIIHHYIPVFYAILNPRQSEICYCNAGMEPAMFLRETHIQFLNCGGPPLGAFDDSEYEEDVIACKQDDVLLMMTDGITDLRNMRNHEFGIEHVKDSVRKYRGSSIQTMLNRLTETALIFMGDAPQKDDITLVGVKMDEHICEETEVVPLSSQERKIKTRRDLEVIEHALEQFLINAACDQNRKRQFIETVLQISHLIFTHSYINANDGQIDYTFVGYLTKVEMIINDYGQGLSDMLLKNEFGTLDELGVTIKQVTVKFGCQFHIMMRLMPV